MGLIKKSLCVVLAFVSLISCRSMSSMEEVEAVINEHTTESLAELRKAVAEAINQRPVTIAKTAFVNSSRLLLTIKKPIGPDGRPIHTGIDEPPIELKLFINKNQCYFRNQQTKQEFELTKASCQPKQ